MIVNQVFFFLLGESESDLDQDNASVDALSSLGTEAIEKLASGLNKAANTIEGYSQNVSCFLVFSIFKEVFWIRQHRHSGDINLAKFDGTKPDLFRNAWLI